jgi:transcriptional regulator with XRE-family HTH domain
MIDDESRQRRLLGQFLRAHRERLSPAAAGLAAAARRRRTPGLRREEAAELAGISTTWYAWIEQGRDVSMSPHALSRLAEALKLSRAERDYMFELAGRRDPDAPEPPRAGEAPEGLARAVASLAEPAYGLDRLWNACCWNPAAERLFAGWLGGPEPNLIRWIFLDDGARALIEGWEDRARRVLAEFRADFSKSLNDPQMRALVDGLAAESPLFAQWWDEQAVMAREGGLRRFNHPLDGAVAFEQFTFTPVERPDFKLVMLVRA